MLAIGDIPKEEHDVIVIGCGLAGLASALSAYENGVEVVIVEKATRALAGGSGRFTDGVIRSVIKEPSSEKNPHTGIYSEEDFYDDLMKTTKGMCDPELAETLVKNSASALDWLLNFGVEWDIPRPGGPGRRTAKGGGEGLVETLISAAEKRGIKILYETRAIKLIVDKYMNVIGVRVLTKNGLLDLMGKAVILASGGFQANPEMRTKYLGETAGLIQIVRGTRHATGEGIMMALEIGAQPYGHWGGFHTAPIDARSPKLECGVTNIRGFEYGILVNIYGERFVDEGENYYDLIYVDVAHKIIKQPGNLAFSIFDQKIKHLALIHWAGSEAIVADTLKELAERLGILYPERFEKTVNEFNAAVQPGEFNPKKLDGKCTIGIEPPKSNWAVPIDTPPYVSYPLTGGITFTFGGLRINTNAEVLDITGKPIPGLYAVGELTGGFFYHSYPGGSGITRNLVFGRIAGKNAAERAKCQKT